MQASSKRQFPSEPLDVPRLANEALDEVCLLASVCSVGKPASVFRQEFQTWWNETGQEIFLATTQEEECDEEDDDDEDPTSTLQADQKEEKELVESLHSVTQTMYAEKEIQKLEEMDPSEDTPAKDFVAEPSDSSDAESELDEEETETENKLTGASVYTLHDILEKAKFLAWKPKADDHESRMLMRVRDLSKHLKEFVALVRIHEGVLSRATVLGMKKKTNQHNLAEHNLAMARQSFQCSALRQSRQALWKEYSQRVVKAVEENAKDSSDATQVPERIGTTAIAHQESRSFQLLVVRPFTSCSAWNGMRFGVVVASWRGGRSATNENAQKLITSASLPAHLVTTVHVMLLTPFGEDSKTFIGSLTGLELSSFLNHGCFSF